MIFSRPSTKLHLILLSQNAPHAKPTVNWPKWTRSVMLEIPPSCLRHRSTTLPLSVTNSPFLRDLSFAQSQQARWSGWPNRVQPLGLQTGSSSSVAPHLTSRWRQLQLITGRRASARKGLYPSWLCALVSALCPELQFRFFTNTSDSWITDARSSTHSQEEKTFAPADYPVQEYQWWTDCCCVWL
jgi:hypothetical protein